MARKTANIDKHKGRYRNRFTVGGKRYTVYGSSIDEAREKERLKRQQIQEEEQCKAEGYTVDEYFEHWIDNKAGNVKETTIRSNRNLYKAISAAVIDKAGTKFGGLKMMKVETAHVREVQAVLLQDRQTRTVNDSISLLRSIFKAAMDERMIDWNPANAVKPKRRTEKPARDTIHRALTVEETKLFLDEARNRSSWYLNLFLFLLHTGCRIGEAGALLRTDITPKGLQVCRTVTRTETGAYTIGDDTKTAAGRRFIPLDDTAKKAIHDQLAIESLLYGNKVIDMKQPVFRSPRGLLLNDTPVNESIARICQAAGIERFTVHAFRDTFATRCVESGMDVKSLQEIMGHTDVSMTLGLYTHAMDDKKEQQLKAVNFE